MLFEAFVALLALAAQPPSKAWSPKPNWDPLHVRRFDEKVIVACLQQTNELSGVAPFYQSSLVPACLNRKVWRPNRPECLRRGQEEQRDVPVPVCNMSIVGTLGR